MNGEIKKIDSIKNMAVFQGFRWSSSVRDKGNNVAEFKKINILYGRNYSGSFNLQYTAITSWVMKTIANFILRKIKEKNPDQYSALLQNIGMSEEPSEERQTFVEAQ